MKKDIIIYGAGGFGREAAWLIEGINQEKNEWNFLGYLDDNLDYKGMIINDHPVLGNHEWLIEHKKDVYAVCAIGNPLIKEKIITRIQDYQNVRFAKLIHPSVRMSSYVEIGCGSIICAGTVITTNIKLGNHVILNLLCTIGHDAVVNDFCTFFPAVNLSGVVVVGKCTLICTGCQIIQGVTIGENTIIGAGAVVIHDLPANCTAVGVPAKPIKTDKLKKGIDLKNF